MATATTLTTAAAAADTLLTIEARAERAIVQELRLMAKEILGMRTHLALEEREQATAPADQSLAPSDLMPTLTLVMSEPGLPTAYRVSFYSLEHGDLEDVVTLDSFEAGVQLVRDRLSADGQYLITATWANHQGEMTVSTPRLMVLARIEAAQNQVPLVLPPVTRGSSALQASESLSIAYLFDHLLEVG